MKENRGIWVGIIILIILAALAAWLISASQPLNTITSNETARVAVPAGESAAPSATTTRLAAEGVARGSVTKKSGNDVVSIVASLSGESRFDSIFVSTGVAATINAHSTSPYTIFVPVNRAFDLPGASIASLSAAEKKRLVQYHIVSGRAIDLTAQTEGQISSLSGDSINFSYSGGIPRINNSRVLAAYYGTNGVVYVIDAPLLPPQKSSL